MFDEYTDEMLLGFVQESDEDAFTELYRRYWRQLYISALKRISNEDDAKDIIQELFIKLWNRRTTLPDEVKVAEYLYTALRYRIINFIQADEVRLKYANAQLTEQDNFAASVAESSLALQEIESIIEKAVEAMPERMQEVFILSYRKGFTPKEIAVQLSLSVQTVKNYLSSARALLKCRITEQKPQLYAQVLLMFAPLTIS
ncbi:RNA polymerase sigma-70 factor [Pontibacter korlensis]|uniref:RNA polymerase subunit sigma-24 n=2 Tax=Pontibacter korlensis TaxID=400092 RepID=A0A0E3UXM0_9BACT|nr:hypothetical protein PKOR_11880 [Pontibacter korlensis]